MMKLLVSLFFTLAILASGSPRYNEVSWLCTHNSYNATNSGFRIVNNKWSIKEQLDGGVRALMLDLHIVDNKIVLSHGSKGLSFLGSQPLQDELETIHGFLTKNPEVIITLILESYAVPKDVAAAFKKAGLDEFAHSQEVGKQWPTLDDLRKAGKRLIIFSDRAKGKGVPSWYHPVWAHCTETHWSNKNPADLLANRPGRGNKKNSLFILNHFIKNPLSTPKLAGLVNDLAFFKKRHAVFQKSHPDRRPNFITVDFASVGDGVAFVKLLNEKQP